MIVSPSWMPIAELELGVKEVPGPDYHPRIVEYLKTTTLPPAMQGSDETSWCSAFVNWCIIQTGFEGTNLANARSWLDWGTGLAEPGYGCIAVLWRTSIDSWQGHVGFVVGRDADKTYLLGGNQRNSCSIQPYPSARVLSYRWRTE